MTPVTTLQRPKSRTVDAAVKTPEAAKLRFAMLSHPGRVRRSNEDACGARPEDGVFLVCDGMGGAAAGEVASQLALEAFLESLEQRGPERIRPKAARQPSDAGRLSSASPRARLEEAVRAANLAVYRHSQKSRSLHGMGTTLVALLFDNATVPTFWLAHVGDSRCYRLRAGGLEQLTQDHSLVEEQIQAGVLNRLQAESSPIRNIITRAIGSQPAVEAEIAAHAVQSGDLYLLASDGLTRELNDAEIAGILGRAAAEAASLEAACQALVDAANANGGGDNITVLLVACG